MADVHKALLSLSRCADMGFESQFGAAFGCLIDTVTGEVTPLQRQGNLYIFRAWVRAAPFGPAGTKAIAVDPSVTVFISPLDSK